MGNYGFNWIPDAVSTRFELFSTIALLVIGFLLGGQFKLDSLKLNSKALLWISVLAAITTAVVVLVGLLFTSLPIPVVVVLACIASATAPAPIVDIIMEKQDNSPFSILLLQITAIDDIWALLLFSLSISFAIMLQEQGSGIESVFEGLIHIIGAIFLGGIIGLPASLLTGRIRPGQPTLVEILGLVFLCGGLALYLDVSYLIAVMTMGAIITNLAKHHEYPFHEIENIEWPFMVIFFVLAGASLHITALVTVFPIFVVYVLCRILGKILGAYLGAVVSKTSPKVKKWIGVALLPQAGVEIGMALVACTALPQYAAIILPTVIGATVFFELVGPPFTKLAIYYANK